jgi:hypothetical protein
MSLKLRQIRDELKVAASGLSMTKKALERIIQLVDDLDVVEGVAEPQSVPIPPMDETRRREGLKQLRRVGYVPKIK